MKNALEEIALNLKKGNLYIAKQICFKQIKNYGIEICQLECYYLASIFFALKQFAKAKYWIDLTTADPINSIPLKEKIYKNLNLT